MCTGHGDGLTVGGAWSGGCIGPRCYIRDGRGNKSEFHSVESIANGYELEDRGNGMEVFKGEIEDRLRLGSCDGDLVLLVVGW